jgi:hypothetical protein
VSAELSDKERSLQEQIGRSKRELDSLGEQLRAVDAELDVLRDKQPDFDALSQACKSLADLEARGAAQLFWAADSSADSRNQHLHHARNNIAAFSAEVAQVEERRNALIETMNDSYGDLDELHYALRDAAAQEESRRQEWVIERKAKILPFYSQVMPWARGCEEDQRFRRSLAVSVLLAVMTGWLASVIDLPIPERSQIIEVPERVAKLVREEMRRPPPAQPEETIAAPEELPEPEPELAKEQPPDDLPESPEQGSVADAEPAPAREQIKSKGILAFRDSFASVASLRPSAQLGAEARLSSAGAEAIGRTERSMVATLAPGSSGGINLASISRDVGGGGGGGGGLAGVQVSRVASSIGGNGNGNGDGRPLSGGASAGRTDEEIQIVFDRYKASLYRLYNRELRKDPTLRGQLILRMTIEPDGSVSYCALQSTDMNAPVLTEQIVQRVAAFDFGAKEDIVAVTIIYPIDFLPAA